MKDKILAVVHSKGPVLPIEVASAIDTNSFLAKAYLSELVTEGKIKVTNERIGTSHLYFVAGQEQAVSAKLADLIQQGKTAKMYQTSDKRTSVTPELAKKRQEFSEMAKRVESEDKKVKIVARPQVPNKPFNQQSTPLPEPAKKLPNLIPRFSIFRKPAPQPKVIEVKAEPQQKPELQIVQNITSSSKMFVDEAKNFLEAQNGRITDVLERKKKFAEFNALIPTAFGEFKVLVHIRDKKKITDSDLSLLYSKASQRNIPGLLITNGQLNRKAQRFLDTIKDSVKVKNL